MTLRPRSGPFGAIMAGGESRRYGSPKALATVGGRRIIDRVVSALGAVVEDPDRDLVVIANEPDLFDDLGLPIRPDIRPGLGALGGIHTALHWAREAGRPGILAVACDMPFLSTPLLDRLRRTAFGPSERNPGRGAVRRGAARNGAEASDASAGPETAVDAPDAVVPGSRSRRGVEPLCAAYNVSCLPAIEAQLARGESHVIGFYDDIRVETLSIDEVAALCDPVRAFLNVNTTGDRERAEKMAVGMDRGGASSDG